MCRWLKSWSAMGVRNSVFLLERKEAVTTRQEKTGSLQHLLSTFVQSDNCALTTICTYGRFFFFEKDETRQAIKCGYPAGDTPHIIKTRNTGTTNSLRILSTTERKPSSAIQVHQFTDSATHPAQFHIIPTPSTTPQT